MDAARRKPLYRSLVAVLALAALGGLAAIANVTLNGGFPWFAWSAFFFVTGMAAMVVLVEVFGHPGDRWTTDREV